MPGIIRWSVKEIYKVPNKDINNDCYQKSTNSLDLLFKKNIIIKYIITIELISLYTIFIIPKLIFFLVYDSTFLIARNKD